jgi:hypothetical protein
MEFDRLLTEVRSDVPSINESNERGSARTLVDEFADVASISPLTAVLDAYDAVDQALRDLIAQTHPDHPIERDGTERLIDVALANGTITPEMAKNIEGIAVLRNLAAHGSAGDVTPERAREYLALVDAILFTIRRRTET